MPTYHSISFIFFKVKRSCLFSLIMPCLLYLAQNAAANLLKPILIFSHQSVHICSFHVKVLLTFQIIWVLQWTLHFFFTCDHDNSTIETELILTIDKITGRSQQLGEGLTVQLNLGHSAINWNTLQFPVAKLKLKKAQFSYLRSSGRIKLNWKICFIWWGN